MTTTDLLRDALRADAEAAAATDRIAALRAELLTELPEAPAPLPRRRADRRPVVLACAAAAVVAVAVVSLFVALRGGRGDTPAGSRIAVALPLTGYVFTVEGTGGHPFAYGGTSTGVQGGFWSDPSSHDVVAVLDVMGDPGALPRPADATPVRIGGTTGWTAPHGADQQGLYFGIGADGTVVAWQDPTTGLQVAVASDRLDAAALTTLADGVRVGARHPVTSPLRLRWTPPDTALSAVDSSEGYFQLVFGPQGSKLVVGVGPVGTLVDPGRTHRGSPRPVHVGRFTGSYYADEASTILTDGTVDLMVVDGAGQSATTPGQALPLATLERLVAGISVADLDDPSTWTDLDAALPS